MGIEEDADLKGKVEGCVDLSVSGEGWSFAHLGGWRWGGVAVPSLPFTRPLLVYTPPPPPSFTRRPLTSFRC